MRLAQTQEQKLSPLQEQRLALYARLERRIRNPRARGVVFLMHFGWKVCRDTWQKKGWFLLPPRCLADSQFKSEIDVVAWATLVSRWIRRVACLGTDRFVFYELCSERF